MPNEQTNAAEVKLSLGLAPPLNVLADQLHAGVRGKLISELGLLLGELGIPGKPDVEIKSLGDATSSEDRPLRLSVNGRDCDYSNMHLDHVLAYLSDEPWKQSDQEVPIQKRVRELYDQWRQNFELNIDRMADLFVLICMETIKARSSVLFGPSQAASYAQSLSTTETRPETWPPDPGWMRAVLSKVLDLRISIADRSTVGLVLANGLLANRPAEEIGEELINALRSDAVEIQISLSYLKAITSARPAEDRSKFSGLRDGLFYELGLRFPTVRFVTVEDLRPDSFRFKINHLTTLPRRGLSPTQCLVNETPSELMVRNIQATAAGNPISGHLCSVVDSTSIPELEKAGVFLWTPIAYVFLSLVGEVMANGASFVHREAVQGDLDQLELAFPELVNAQGSRSVWQMTRVLRSLIAEKISIRNLKLILERILEYDYVVADSSRYIVFDERLPANIAPPQAWLTDPGNIAAFIRIGMKRYIKDKYARAGTLKVYLVERELEEILSNYGIRRFKDTEDAILGDDERQEILKAVRGVLGDPSTSDNLALILTNTSVRSTLRELIAGEFPERGVLAYEELPGDLSIQAVGKISFNN